MLDDVNAQISSRRQGAEYLLRPLGPLFYNSYFKDKWIHRKRWKSPDVETENEIDYIESAEDGDFYSS